MDVGSAYGLVMLMLIVCGLILTVVWIVLPFAVIGIKPLMRQILAELQVANRLLQDVRDRLPPERR